MASFWARDRAAASDGRHLTRLALVAIVSGLITGVVGAAFRMTLDLANAQRDAFITWARQWPDVGWLLTVLAAAALVATAAWMVQRFAPLAAGSGVQHVEAVMRGEATPAPFAVLPVKFVGGVLAIGSGLALGREGPTVQMGAVIGARVAQRAALDAEAVRLVQSAAAGAGLAVAFNAPIGGVAFVFEELSRRFTTPLMVATLAACTSAELVARMMLGNSVDFTVPALPSLATGTVAASLLLGALLGVLGAAYNRTLLVALDRFAAFPTVPIPIRAAFVGGVVGLVAWFEPRLVGGGDPLIQAVLDRHLSLSLLAVLFVARWLLGPFSYGAGTPGGLFAPLLVVGALVGAFFAEATNIVLPAATLSPPLLAIVGMAAFFTAVVRAPFTGTLLVLGMTGTIEPLLPVLASAIVATIVPTAAGSAPIYDTLRERMEQRLSPIPPTVRPDREVNDSAPPT